MWQKHVPIGHEYKTVYNEKGFFKHYGRGCKGEDIFEVSASFWRSLFYLKGTPNQTKNLLAEDLSVSAERFELSTNGLKGHCSAIELRAHHFNTYSQTE